MGVTQPNDAEMNTVTTVDISSLFQNGIESARADVDARIGEAIRSHGGFVIDGYPGGEEVDIQAKKMLRFFDLDDAEKRSIANISTAPDAKRLYRGYASNLKPGGFAYNEMFDIGPSHPSPAPTEGARPFAEENIWPEDEPVEGWRLAMENYYDTLQAVGKKLLLSVGRSVGLPEFKLEEYFDGGNSTLRLINYPVPPKSSMIGDAKPDDAEPRLSTASHTDGSGLSILWSRQPGLQARSPDGVWRDIPQQANGVSVHLGDVMEAMTEGRIQATPHRVVEQGVARQSIGFFLEPRLDAQLGSIINGSVDNDIRNSYGWMLQKRFSRYPQYKDKFLSPE